MHSIKTSWKKITAWYEINSAEQPGLSAGASVKEIADLESSIGLVLPDDVKASYRLHNGTANQGGIFSYGYYLLSVSEISKERKNWVDGLKKGAFEGMDDLIDAKGPIKKKWWNTKWIPITGSGGGDFRCVDMDPATKGTIGQIIYFNHEAGPKRVEDSGWGEYLSNFADDLERGMFHFEDGTLVPKRKRP